MRSASPHALVRRVGLLVSVDVLLAEEDAAGVERENVDRSVLNELSLPALDERLDRVERRDVQLHHVDPGSGRAGLDVTSCILGTLEATAGEHDPSAVEGEETSRLETDARVRACDDDRLASEIYGCGLERRIEAPEGEVDVLRQIAELRRHVALRMKESYSLSQEPCSVDPSRACSRAGPSAFGS